MWGRELRAQTNVNQHSEMVAGDKQTDRQLMFIGLSLDKSYSVLF